MLNYSTKELNAGDQWKRGSLGLDVSKSKVLSLRMKTGCLSLATLSNANRSNSRMALDWLHVEKSAQPEFAMR
jgi:hypothetical protein